jgi:predicted alpha/beta-hydrolase family hydrolase
LHPAGRPSKERGQHLFQVSIPMLFLQGTRDALADTQLMPAVTQQLGSRANLTFFKDADHSFHVTARSGRNDAEVRTKMLDAFTAWMETYLNQAD